MHTDNGLVPQGTIIHPSVYQCLEFFVIQTLSLNRMLDEKRIENWRPKMLGKWHYVANQGSWDDEDAEPLEYGKLKTIRIVVCGSTGVGKSTLINRVFGVDPGDREVVSLQSTFILTHVRLTSAADEDLSS